MLCSLFFKLTVTIRRHVSAGCAPRLFFDNLDFKVLVNIILKNHRHSDMHWIAHYVLNIRQSTLWSPRWFQTCIWWHTIWEYWVPPVSKWTWEVAKWFHCLSGPYSCWILWIHGASQICHTKAYPAQVGITIVNYDMLYMYLV